MIIYNISGEVDALGLKIKETRSVLSEAAKYLQYNIEPDTIEAHALIISLPHIHRLLCVVNDSLMRMDPSVTDIHNKLFELIKNDKTNQ